MGGKTSTTTQQVQIPKEVLDRYNAVNTRAEGLGDTPFKQYSTDPAAFVAQLNNQQLAGTNQINASAGAYQPYFAQAGEAMRAGMGSAQPGELNLGQFYNPYQQQVIDATMKQMGQANEQAQSGALGTAISSGAFGGDRAGIAAANLANQQGLAMGSTLAGLNAQNYNQALAAAQQQQGVQLGATQADLARLMQGGQFYAGLGQAAQQAGIQGGEAMLNAGTLGQQTEQAGLSALYNQFQQQQAYPFQIAQFLANIAMGTGALSGSTTATTQPSSFWSDRRLKHDIKRIGTSDNGLPVYTFKYKGDDTEQTHVGYMADEVEKKHPDAVGVAGNGYKYVDYDRASRAEGGGVAGPYGAAFGSQDPYAAGYVPQAVLPIGQLITADPALLQQAEQSLAEQLQAANQFGENISGLKDKYDAVREWWNGEDPDTGPQRTADSGKVANARGGVVAYASGGPAYLSAGLAGRQNPVEKSTYLTDTLDSQGKRNDELMRPNSSPERQKSGLENVVDLGKMAMGLFGFQEGGRVGYAPGGVPDEEEARRKLLLNELPQPQTLGSLPEATVTPASDRMTSPAVPDVRPAPRPEGLAAASAVSEIPATRPMPRPEGLAAASVAPEIPSTRPVARPAGLVPPSPEATSVAADTLAALGRGNAVQTAAPAVAPPGVAGARAPEAEIDPRSFYRTNIIRQESGGRQFDENGQPLTSSAGAVGVGQVMEGTGPEAAALAGLEWDRDRWLNDAKYNAAIGEAYFLEQYRRFGSLDKAAAAYNAGPGALASAMDRAAALGGSYLDYLPAETQNYVLATSGMGDGAPAPRGGLAPASDAEPSMRDRLMGVVPMGGDTAYDERSRLGQMFYDENGRVNKDALLSILSGIGTMASSPSRYLGASILQGIGGAANTYMAREQQRSAIGATNLENMRKIMSDTIAYNELHGTNYTPEQYARINGIEMPRLATAETIAGGAYTPTTGDNIDKMTYNELQNGTVMIDGKTVRRENDPDSLRRYINDNSMFRGMEGPLGNSVASAEARLAEIEAKGGVTFDVNGNEVVVPSYAAAGNEQAQIQANREASIQFRNTGIERLPVIDQQLADADKQVLIFTQLQAGALTNEITSAAAVLDALGMPVPEGAVADRALAQEAIKIQASKTIGELSNLPGGAPKAELDRLAQVAANPDLQPEAVKMILTMQKAVLLREQDKYAMRDQWNAENPDKAFDQFAYEQWFAENRPYSAYYDEVKKSMPIFAGETGSKQKPMTGITEENYGSVPVGAYYIGSDGKTYGPKQAEGVN